MNAQVLVAALELPSDCLIERRIPKTTLTEHGSPSRADKRLLQDGIDELHWVAALKPTNIGVPALVTSELVYTEIEIISVVLRPMAKAARITELLHRAMPYPVVLVGSQSETIWFSLAHKRRSQAEEDKFVIQSVETLTVAAASISAADLKDFMASLPVSAQPRRDLHALYQGWIDRIAALQASRITGAFSLHPQEEEAEARRRALAEHADLQKQITALRQRAGREKQINRRVDLNLKIKQLEDQLALAVSRL